VDIQLLIFHMTRRDYIRVHKYHGSTKSILGVTSERYQIDIYFHNVCFSSHYVVRCHWTYTFQTEVFNTLPPHHKKKKNFTDTPRRTVKQLNLIRLFVACLKNGRFLRVDDVFSNNRPADTGGKGGISTKRYGTRAIAVSYHAAIFEMFSGTLQNEKRFLDEISTNAVFVH